MSKFRKKPIVIEAYQFSNRIGHERPQWILDAVDAGTARYQGGNPPYLTIETLEGTMRANLFDWVIRGVNGELYPCKPDVFAKTYDPV